MSDASPSTSPWARPEAGAGPPPTPTGVAGGGLGGPTRPIGGPPPVPGLLRPTRAVGVLDGAFELLKVRPRALLGAAALIVVPAQAAAALLREVPLRPDVLGALVALEEAEQLVDTAGVRLWQPSVAGTGALLVEVVATFLVGVVVARTVGAWHAGDDPGPLRALRDGLARPSAWVPALAAALAIKAAASVVVCIGTLLAVTWLALLAPAIGIERLGAGDALTRSWRLANRRFGFVLGAVVGIAVVDLLVRFALTALPWLVADELPDVAAIAVRAISVAAAAVVSSVIVGAAATAVYLELRVRTEGLDLELEATDAFASPT